MSESQDFLIIGSVWPEPNSSAAGKRMMQLIALFQSAGWNIIFACSAAESSHAAGLASLGIRQVPIKINSATFDTFIRGLQPSAVMFDRFIIEEQFGWRVAEQCPQAVRILDTEDLHCLRRARKKALKEARKFRKEDLLREDSAKREIASIWRCDLSLIISDYEVKLLREFFNVDHRLLQYVPFMVAPIDKERIESWPPFGERNHFITVGNFRHEPNWDAIRYLKQAIWPLIRKELPAAELHIYGAYPSKKAKKLHQPDDGFLIKGRANDARTVVEQARVYLAPLRFGAGLKGKLVEAMQCGTPSVTTPIGGEGIGGKMDWSGTICQTPQDLAAAAIKLYLNKGKWLKARQRGTAIINQRFSGTPFGTDLLDNIDQIQGHLTEHRLQNFTGGMLRYHTAASTKYMSRWIEAKNRLKNIVKFNA